jgi:hypothetical protein
MAFGTYYRRKLRQLVVVEFPSQDQRLSGDQSTSSGLDELWLEYAFLANLL